MTKTKLFWCILACCIGIYTSCAGAPEALEVPSEGHHKVMFLAYARGTPVENNKKSIAGHASIAIEGSGIWGFYPTTPGMPITKRGVLQHNTVYPIIHEYAEFFVDEDRLNKIKELIAKWENNPPPFVVPFSDCVTFINRVCDIIGLKYNHLAVMPTTAVRRIRLLNARPRGIE
ncbi:hypothetical protein AGMMS49942_14130 [Spirochaetia bacterium]|nr:hypothetical protein AGMMS49942_14130 [Spirochaetia bacterium]